MTADHITGKLENIISGHQINADDAAWLRGLISAPAEGDADRHRLDFIQANPNLTLRHYKRHWSLAGVTSYEHRVFKTVREAIDHAMNGGKDD